MKKHLNILIALVVICSVTMVMVFKHYEAKKSEFSTMSYDCDYSSYDYVYEGNGNNQPVEVEIKLVPSFDETSSSPKPEGFKDSLESN